MLTALLGSLLKDAERPADPAGADRERRRRPAGLRLSRRRAARLCPPRSRAAGRGAGRTRRCSRCSARAIWRSPSTSRRPNERYQGIVPLEGESLAEAAQSYFAQSEQIPIDRPPGRAQGRGGLGRRRPDVPASARRRGGARPAAHAARPSRMAACRGARRIGEAGGADRSASCRSTTWSGGCSTRRRRCAPWRRCALRRGCRCSPDYVALGDRPLPARGARRDGRRGRPDPGRLRILRDQLPDRCSKPPDPYANS